MVLDQSESFHRLHHTFRLYTNIPWDQKSKQGQGRVRVGCDML